jgi:hypothetical protein
MRTLVGLTIMAALGATAAQAQPARLSDAAYMQAARCVGLASSGKLGATDADAMKDWLKEQRRLRDAFVRDKADRMEEAAKREANSAGEQGRARLSDELNGPCAALKS